MDDREITSLMTGFTAVHPTNTLFVHHVLPDSGQRSMALALLGDAMVSARVTWITQSGVVDLLLLGCKNKTSCPSIFLILIPPLWLHCFLVLQGCFCRLS